MYLFGGPIETLLKTLLAQRMGGDITVTDFTPRVTVTILVGRVAMELIVLAVGNGFMFGAIALACNFWAAWVGARMRRLVGHRFIFSDSFER